MRAQPILLSAALFLALFGLSCLFVPATLLARVGTMPQWPALTGVQLLGSIFLGFAALNWFSRRTPAGGIYSRPLVVGNFMHFGCGAMVCAKSLMRPHDSLWLTFLTLTIIYAVFAIAFGALLFGKQSSKTDKQ
ncbi:MAG TPA: hypothetical protein VN982_13720 [Candidatus Dormibacteraeota bacterium]|nr:hypothetical protein [Candidatus Dormibacteraeota bacterium]